MGLLRSKKILIGFSALVLLLIAAGLFSDSDSPDQFGVEQEEHGDVQRVKEGIRKNTSVPERVFGDGEVLITFEVKVPEWTPKEDRIYVRIDGFYYGANGGVPMERTEQDVWRIFFLAPADRALRYKYNRNDFGYSTDEEFSPDREETTRSVDVGAKSLTVKDEVLAWRWLSEEPPQAALSTFEPDDIPERDEPFIIGVFPLDFFNEGFMDYIPSTLDRVEAKGFEYIGIAYAPATFSSTNPLIITHNPNYSKEQLDFFVNESRKRGLKILLSAGIETDVSDAETFDEIEAGYRRRQNDDWYLQLAREWEEAMVRTAELAEKHHIEIFTPSNQWPFWGDKTDEQKKMLNTLINEAYRSIRQVYSGKISSDYYDGDELFDYYTQMDWIGDKWWWKLADNKETSLEEMKIEAERIIDEYYAEIFKKYGKPIFLQQLAYSSFDGAAGALDIGIEGPEIAEWFPYNPEYPADFQEQADAFEAVFQAIYDETIFVGAFSFGYTYWDSYDKSPVIRGKPAEDVWAKWNTIFTRE